MLFKSSLPILALAVGASADGPWKNPDGGNTKVDIGDNKVNWGFAPPWDVLDGIKEHCLSTGCSSDQTYEYSSGIVQDGELKNAKISVAAAGSFNDGGEEGNLDQLVELVKTVVANSPYDVDKGVKYRTGNGCVVAGPTPCDPGNEEQSDQYKATDLIVVRVEGEDGDLKADMNVHITVDVEDSSKGVCETITKVGGAMSGAVNGIIGGIFTLASLGCK